jgi:hypothetical protein
VFGSPVSNLADDLGGSGANKGKGGDGELHFD